MSIMSNNNNNKNDETQSNTESGDLGPDTVVQMSEDVVRKPTFFGKNCCRTILLLCLVILLSFFTSVVTTQCLLNMFSTDSDAMSSDDVENKGSGRHGHQTMPVVEKQVQERPPKQPRVGAQLSVDQDRLKDKSPRLVWTHKGTDDYLDGVNHVTQYHGNHQYDCLEATQDGHYLISMQLTYYYSARSPSSSVRSYFTLTRFRNNEPYVIAKSDHVVPPKAQRVATVTKQPVTVVRSDPLRKGDRLCVMMPNPKLIYASKIDNFFGMVAL